MSTVLLIGIVQMVLGVLVNMFIGKIVMVLFKKDGTLPRIPIRFFGVWLLLQGIARVFHV